jgi:hypothetical protein
MSEIPGQSGHALPDLQPPVCAKNRRNAERHRPSNEMLWCYAEPATATKPGIINAGRRFPDGSPHARRRQPWMLETGVAALPTVAKLIRGFDGIVQKSRILPHAVDLEWQGF